MLSPNIVADYEKIKNLFAAALELAPEKRADFFTETGADAHLIAEVESLLEARAKAGEFLNNVSAAATVHDSISRNDKFLGQTIDRYRIEREIGRGGMGVVFLATREDFHQQVALKLIKRGMDSDQILERFRREREILAALNHPFIARLLDGGTTDDGLPFFVMEYVEGVPVNEFCRRENLSEKEKLELFRKVCEALIFAHQKLIVHRDLKPSNILVGKDGTPKLLDFGIAKLLDSDEAETQTNQRVLTPAYASPEQLRGDAVDTTSDVYSLGKILAQILLGDNSKSLKFSTIENPTANATKQNLNHDLRNILAMSLREDAARRYRSVEKFSEDIRRYLVGLPVSARRDTFSYRAAKFLKRNRLAVAVSVLFALTLLIGSAATFIQARRAQRQQTLAERRLDNLRKMSDSFTTEIHGAIQNLPGSLPARQMLMRHAVEQLDALAAESDGNLALRDELAQAYLNSAQLPDMLLTEKDATLRKAIKIYRQLVADDPANSHYQEQMALGYSSLGDITKVRGSVADSLEYYKTSVSMLERIAESEPESTEHLVNLSETLIDAGRIYIMEDDIENASQLSQRTLTALEEIRKINADQPELASLANQTNLQITIEQTREGNYQPAIETLRRILGEYETQLARNENDTRVNYYLFVIHRRLADTLEQSGDASAASEHLQTALSIIENLLASSPKDFGYHRNAAATHVLYGEMLTRQKQSAEALEHFRRAVELSKYVLESDTDNSEAKIDLARATANIGNALVLTGKKKEGSENLQKAFGEFQELYARDGANAELKRDYFQTRDWLDAAATNTPAVRY
ncbi:MAG: protein kinase domain-containing protein [Pyrinomonadaceae bacterium]